MREVIMKRTVVIAAAGVAAVTTLWSAPPASAEATPEWFDCTFEPGDVPGVDVYFPATCHRVTTPDGQVNIIGTGELPEGFTLTHTVVTELPCFGGVGTVTATKSGQVIAVCLL
jgi:hypothetical protein